VVSKPCDSKGLRCLGALKVRIGNTNIFRPVSGVAPRAIANLTRSTCCTGWPWINEASRSRTAQRGPSPIPGSHQLHQAHSACSLIILVFWNPMCPTIEAAFDRGVVITAHRFCRHECRDRPAVDLAVVIEGTIQRYQHVFSAPIVAHAPDET